jgi:hypothetical protein
MAYVIYPNVQTSKKVFTFLDGTLDLTLDSGEKTTATVEYSASQLSGRAAFQAATTSQASCLNDLQDMIKNQTEEVIVHDDWLCSHCGVKNFSKRMECIKCGR